MGWAQPIEPGRWAFVRSMVDRQAEDEGLWFNAETAGEAYLQKELRRLHDAIECATPTTVGAVGPVPSRCRAMLGSTRCWGMQLHDGPHEGPVDGEWAEWRGYA